MRVLFVLSIMILFTGFVYAQGISPVVEFFMHNRSYDTFLRDHFQFNEPNPLRIEYWNVNWVDSHKDSNDYKDSLHLEGLFPIYTGDNLIIDIPFSFSYMPAWAENEDNNYGRKINVLEPHLMVRWKITKNLKSIIGWEYKMKGDSEDFKELNNLGICLLKGFLSYDLNPKFNLIAGSRLDWYNYNSKENSGTIKISDSLFYQPAAMINWHPNGDLKILLGIPYSGIYISISDIIKAEARASFDKSLELALKLYPISKTNVNLRFLNIPYLEIPVIGREFGGNKTTGLSYKDKSISLEFGRQLNPAAEATLGIRYGFAKDMNLLDEDYKKVFKLDGKSHFDIGATFTLELEALFNKR
ncbi:hypothetical protein FJZ33_02375 [Candidatus Poribacteria bacterium]|nr:hypothetical protein [Candidatus Poribacteria bacterium]